MSPRPPNMHEKLAAALLENWRLQGDPLPREEAKLLSAYEICALVEWHHEVKRAHDGGNHPTNLTPLLYKAHRTRTAKIDNPEIKKGRRLAKKEAEHQAAVRAKILAPRSAFAKADAILSRRGINKRIANAPGFGKQHRPLQSRSTFEKRRK